MATDRSPTIYSVAREAKVSISTVSRVLNSPHLVKKETRNRVLAAIDRLGFVPRAAAQAHAKRKLGRIGVLTPFFTHPSFVQRMRGISSVLAVNSFELVIYPIAFPDQVYQYLETIPVTRRLDGLITMALSIENSIAKRFTANQFPLVTIEFSHPLFSNVYVDNFEGGRLAAEYLFQKGHKRFGFIGDGELPEYAIRPSDERFKGYLQYLQEKGVTLLDELVVFPYSEQVTDQIRQLLEHPQRPTAIFAANDELAMQVVSAARKEGLLVPQELSVIGFDDLDYASHIGLTTISQQLDKSGLVAAELLLSQIGGRQTEPKSAEMKLSIVERDTT